jgi:methylase of polypeptide subunit release factors
MIIERIDTIPVQRLLAKHLAHQAPYDQEFHGLQLVIFPEVFNPAYTQVSGFLADHLTVTPGSRVLDMFSGSGFLSFLAARIADSVLGVDVSPHAIRCAQYNSERLDLSQKTEFRVAKLWGGVGEQEKFDLIIANLPLLPATPENWLEMAIADGPEMSTSVKFIQGCANYLNENGRVLMSFSNACQVYFDDPLGFINKTAHDSGLTMDIKAERDAGYEIYRILQFRRET